MKMLLQALLWLALAVGLWFLTPWIFFYIPLIGVSEFGERGGAFFAAGTIAAELALLMWLGVALMRVIDRKFPKNSQS